MAPLTFEV